MNIFSKLSSILFSKTITVEVDFINEKFIVSLFQNEKPYSIENGKNHDIINTYLARSNKVNVNSAEITLYAAEKLYGDIKQSTKGILYSLSERSEKVHFKSLNNEVKFKLYFDEATGKLLCELQGDAKWIGEEYILFNNIIWRVPSSEIQKLLHYSKLDGEDILNMIKYSNKSYIDSNIKIDNDSILTISCKNSKDGSLAIMPQIKYPKESWIKLSGLEYYAESNNIVFKIPGIFMETRWNNMFTDGLIRYVTVDQLPKFVEEFWDIINKYGDNDIKEKLSPSKFFWKPKEISLELECVVERKNGIGKAFAVPVCRFGDKLVSAKELSLSTEVKNCIILDKHLSLSCLEQIGIGVMGRMIDGTVLNPIELKANEIIYRGSERLEGLWKKINFIQDCWKVTGSTQEITKSHLTYLQTFGINGGVILPESNTIDLIKQSLYEYCGQDYINTKKLILIRKKMLNELDLEKLQDNFVILKGLKSDPILSNQNNRNVICTYTILEKYASITSIDWDIILMIEPDEQFKTSSSVIYQSVRKITGAIKLGIFSSSPKSYSAQKSLAMSDLFGISIYDNPNVCMYQIREVDSSLELPKAYEFKRKKPIKLAQPVEIRIDGAEEHTYSIPKRKSNEIIINGMSVKIEMSYGSTDGSSEFKREALKNVSYSGSPCSFTPFMSYWPTYSTMNYDQKKWYYYWRKMVREGTYIDTDLSYIFIYIYELLNGVGYVQPAEGFEMIWSTWQAYDEKFSELSKYLSNWTLDFVIINKLDDKLEKLLSSSAICNNNILFNIHIYKRYIEESATILLEDVLQIISYSISKSKVSLKGHESLLRQELQRVINIINKETINKYGKNLFALFCPIYKTEESKYAYSSAVYDGNIKYNISYFSFKQHSPLEQFLTFLVKEIENRVRKKVKHNGQLKGIELDEFFLNIINKEYPEENIKKKKKVTENVNSDQVSSNYLESKPLKMNSELLNQLRKESTEIQEILMVEDEEDNSKKKDLYVDSSQEKLVEEKLIEKIPLMEAKSESDDEVVEFITELVPYKIEALLILLSGMDVEEQLKNIAMNNQTMLEIMLDEINEEFGDKVGDILIDTRSMPHCIFEEYVEELRDSIERMKNNE